MRLSLKMKEINMNKYVRGIFVTFNGFCKTLTMKVLHMRKYNGIHFAQISLFTEITIDGGHLFIGKKFKMRDNSKIRVRKNSTCTIGNDVSINTNDMIVCRNSISIGDGVELAPNVFIYDHDHKFRCEKGIKANEYVSKPIEIGKNVWIGANSVILKGARIGDGAVIAANSVVDCDVPSNTVFIQKKQSEIKQIR